MNLFLIFFLYTGSLGQLGQGLAKVLRAKYGRDNVIMSDIIKAPKHILEMGKCMVVSSTPPTPTPPPPPGGWAKKLQVYK